MIAMDIGNTHARLAVLDGGVPVWRAGAPTRSLELDALRRLIQSLPRDLADRNTVWIASVAPHRNALVAGALEHENFGYRFIASAFDEIIPHRLETPQTTGVDRLLAALAARTLYFPEAPGLLVVQCGSAATVDWVDGGGVFRGGVILPGPSLWLSGLSGAAQLPDLSSEVFDWDAVAPGLSSRDAIAHGLAVGLPAAVLGAVGAAARAAAGDCGCDPKKIPLVLTGGWAEVMSPRFDRECRLDKDLVLRGIQLFAEKGTKR